MICPKCTTGIHFEPRHTGPVYSDAADKPTGFDVAEGFCPECDQFLVLLRRGRYWQGDYNKEHTRELSPDSYEIIYPPTQNRRLQPPEVPDPYKKDFAEATTVLSISPKASAAISRRMLQQILREELKIERRNLADEIATFILGPGIPSHLTEAVDAVRQVGNLAAHPMKSTHTGEILDVEPGEAEWLLDVLDALFDFTFVQPKRLASRKAALDEKLASTRKLPAKI